MRSTFSRRIRFEQLEQRNMLAVAIPGDYDQSGIVDNGDYNLWRANFGTVADSPVDGNGDGFVDAADYVVWRKNNGKIAPPDAPREISAAAVGATSIQVSWQTVSAATSYSVQRRQPDTETEFTTIASGLATNSYTDNSATTDTLYEYRTVATNANGDSPASKTAEAVANRANLTAYRPQSVQDPDSPIDEPIYAPFPKKAVREQDEMSNTLGPGIRANWDWDNGGFNTPDVFESGYEIPLENDLIEVKVDRLPGQGNLVLTVGSRLTLYLTHDKEMPLPMADPFTSEPLPFVNNTVTVFVEYNDSTHGTDTLSLVEPATMMTHDSIRFHSFRSMVVVFGGRTQNPNDTDGDGSIGDVVQGTNREGIFDLAQALYDSGWDVMAFDSTDPNIDNVVSVAEAEIKNAWDRRFISPLENGTGFAVLGYSWGGGVTHNIIERLYNDGYVSTLGAYVDAVIYPTLVTNTPEDDWPDETFYLLNIWQPNPTLEYGGAAIVNPEEMPPGAELEEIELAGEDHYSIDDDPFVHQRIQTRLNENVLR